MENIKDWFTGSKSEAPSKEITAHTVVGLTELGSSKVDASSMDGHYYKIAAVLKEEGPSSLAEIGQETHIPVYKLKFLVKTMIKNGYLRKVGATGE